MSNLRTALAAVCFAGALLVPAHASAAAIVPGSLANTLPSIDDVSASPVGIGFSINFYGTTFTQLSVNENGNITFADAGYGDYTVGNLADTGRPIIAGFLGDVDTLGAGSGNVTYGNLTIGGRQVFAVDYTNVGYFDSNTDKLNSFQILLINRSDTGAGNFDLELNYNQVQWESGDASGGFDGLGGGSAVAGFSSTGTPAGNTFEFAGSAVNGALIDGGPNSLVAGTNTNTAGRYHFSFRAGSLATPEPGTAFSTLIGLALAALALKLRLGLNLGSKSRRSTTSC